MISGSYNFNFDSLESRLTTITQDEAHIFVGIEVLRGWYKLQKVTLADSIRSTLKVRIRFFRMAITDKRTGVVPKEAGSI